MDISGINDLSCVYISSQHVLGHHPYTNIDGADPDIVTAAAVSKIKYFL